MMKSRLAECRERIRHGRRTPHRVVEARDAKAISCEDIRRAPSVAANLARKIVNDEAPALIKERRQ